MKAVRQSCTFVLAKTKPNASSSKTTNSSCGMVVCKRGWLRSAGDWQALRSSRTRHWDCWTRLLRPPSSRKLAPTDELDEKSAERRSDLEKIDEEIADLDAEVAEALGQAIAML